MTQRDRVVSMLISDRFKIPAQAVELQSHALNRYRKLQNYESRLCLVALESRRLDNTNAGEKIDIVLEE